VESLQVTLPLGCLLSAGACVLTSSSPVLKRWRMGGTAGGGKAAKPAKAPKRKSLRGDDLAATSPALPAASTKAASVKKRKAADGAQAGKQKKAKRIEAVEQAAAPAADEAPPARQRWQRLDEATVQYYTEVSGSRFSSTV